MNDLYGMHIILVNSLYLLFIRKILFLFTCDNNGNTISHNHSVSILITPSLSHYFMLEIDHIWVYDDSRSSIEIVSFLGDL